METNYHNNLQMVELSNTFQQSATELKKKLEEYSKKIDYLTLKFKKLNNYANRF
jgi:uncharacterized coiled-coil protein SlyX